jgi:hypothetical protein
MSRRVDESLTPEAEDYRSANNLHATALRSKQENFRVHESHLLRWPMATVLPLYYRGLVGVLRKLLFNLPLSFPDCEHPITDSNQR